MSYEHFETVMAADMRTAPDHKTIEYALPGDGKGARWPEDRSGWITGVLYAHDAVELAAQTVEDEPMDGISGDHPARRAQAVAILRASANVVKMLAADAAYDGTLTDERWAESLAAVRDSVAVAEVA